MFYRQKFGINRTFYVKMSNGTIPTPSSQIFGYATVGQNKVRRKKVEEQALDGSLLGAAGKVTHECAAEKLSAPILALSLT